MKFCVRRFAIIATRCRCSHIPDAIKNKDGTEECFFEHCGACELQLHAPGVVLESITPQKALEIREEMIRDENTWRVRRRIEQANYKGISLQVDRVLARV